MNDTEVTPRALAMLEYMFAEYGCLILGASTDPVTIHRQKSDPNDPHSATTGFVITLRDPIPDPRKELFG